MNNNTPKKDEPRDRTPLEVKIDTIILFLVLITFLLIIILGLIGYFYLEFHNNYGDVLGRGQSYIIY